MSAQLMILPTGEAMRANRPLFNQLPKEGLPLMVLTQYLIQLLVQGDPEKLSKEEVLDGWCNYLLDTGLMTERLSAFVARPAFADALYALYDSLQDMQEVLMTAPGDRQGCFLSGLTHHGWNGDDMIVSRELTTLGDMHSFKQRIHTDKLRRDG